MKERDIPLFATSAVATLFIGFNVLSLGVLFEYLDLIKMPSNKYSVLVPLGTILIVIYFSFVKPLKFLTYGFKKDIKGGIGVVLYILATVILSVTIANLNRAKLKEQRKINQTQVDEANRRPSLEGDIKKWFNDNF